MILMLVTKKYNMDFLIDFFHILGIPETQQARELDDLTTAIKAQTVKNLLGRISDTHKYNSNHSQAEIAADIKTHFTEEQIQEATKEAIGIVIISYIDFNLPNMTGMQKQKLDDLFTKYNIHS